MHALTERDHWLKLFSAMLDGACDAAGEREVMRLLESDPAARRDFAEMSQLHLWLSEDAGVRRVLDRADAVPDNVIAMPLMAMRGQAAAAAGPAAPAAKAVMAEGAETGAERADEVWAETAAAAAKTMRTTGAAVPSAATSRNATAAATNGRGRRSWIALAAGCVATGAVLLPAGAWVMARQLIDPIIPGRAAGETSLAHWQPVDAERELRPILAKCAACHAAETAGKGGGAAWSFPPDKETTPSGRAVVVAGKPEQSALWLRLAQTTGSDDPHARLTADERTVIRRWIEQQA